MNELLSSSQFLIGRDFPVRILRRDPQVEYPVHSHEFAELVIVYGGSCTHMVYGENMALERGDVFVIHPGTEHGYCDLQNLRLFNIIFDLNALESPLSEFSSYPAFQALFMLEPASGGKRGMRLPEKQLMRLLHLVERMENEEIEQLPGYRIMVAGLFIELVAILGRFYFAYAKNTVSRPLLQLGRIINDIIHDCAKNWTRAAMAERLGISESSLTRLFKKYTGVSPVQYLINIRIKKAVALLQSGDKPVSEIGFLVGFNDSNYFSRQFRRLTGQTPRQCRKSKERLK